MSKGTGGAPGGWKIDLAPTTGQTPGGVEYSSSTTTHSITHEVIGVYQGESILQFGGDGGESIYVQAGDVIVIPAGGGS